MALTLPGALLDGAGIGVATAAWHLLGERQKRKRQARQDEEAQEERTRDDMLAEVSTLRKIIDSVMVFLVGRKEQGGLPGPEGFLAKHERFQRTVLDRLNSIDGHLSANDGRLSALTREVKIIGQEWKPNGGKSSYDRLRRLDERGEAE